MGYRIGFGFDTHQLVEGRHLWLGGVQIEAIKGALGHSDADVLIHAICDALLGALNMRDIGYHFPNTASKWKDVDSKILLREVYSKIKDKGYRIENIDSTVVLEEPKINPYIEKMNVVLAGILETEADNISIKATTNESLGYIGRKEGVNAYAVCMLYKIH